MATDRWNVLVTLYIDSDDVPTVQFRIEVDDEDDLPTIDDRAERAKRTALDALRPFMNNKTYFDAEVWCPQTEHLVADRNPRAAARRST